MTTPREQSDNPTARSLNGARMPSRFGRTSSRAGRLEIDLMSEGKPPGTGRQRNRIQTDDGLLWKRRRGATSTAEEFVEARTRFVQIHEESFWSPWVLEERAAALEHAQSVMRQWSRAEPGFRQMTMEEVREDWAREDAEQAAQRAEAEQGRQLRQAQYDPERERLRLSLLELEGYLRMKQLDRQGLVDQTSFPAMLDDRREVAVRECDADIALLQPQVNALREQLGDPETVVDQAGRFPAERRKLLLGMFATERRDAVHRLRPEVVELTTALEHVRGRKERTEAREQLAKRQAQLDEWLAVPAVSEDEMCSECPRPPVAVAH